MKLILFSIAFLFINIQLTAQTSNGIVSGMGKWVPIKTDFYSNNKLTNTEEFKFSEKCIPYVNFQEGGIITNKDFDSDCKEKKSEPGTYKYIRDGFYRITQNGQSYDVIPKPNGNEMQLIITTKNENGEDLKVVAHFKRYDSFNNDKGKEVEYFENGNIKARGIYLDDQKYGWWDYYNENGDLIKKVDFDDWGMGKKTKLFYPTGKLMAEGIGLEPPGEKRFGIWKYYNENGELVSEGETEQGKIVGIWKFYHNNGKLRETGNFSKGKRDGEFIHYFDNGQIQGIGKYINDNANGEWKIYNKEGEVIKITEYKDGKIIK